MAEEIADVVVTEGYGWLEKLFHWGSWTKRQNHSGWSVYWFNGPSVVWSDSWKMIRFSANGYGCSLDKYAIQGWTIHLMRPFNGRRTVKNA